jgi:glycosyltransferase involved in cell wall biosynthesis
MTAEEVRRLKVVVIDEDLCWPVNNGKRIRTYNLLRRAAQRHDLTLIAYGYEDDDPDAANRLADLGIEVILAKGPRRRRGKFATALGILGGALAGRPYSAALYDTREMRDLVEKVVESSRADLVHIELTTMGGVALGVAGVPCFLNAHNCESQIWSRLADRADNTIESMAFRSQASLMSRFERRLISHCGGGCVVSETDARRLAEIVPGARLDVVPNGVDLDEFTLESDPGRPDSLVFTGALDWRPMQEAVVHLVEDILPRVRRTRPAVRAVVAGRRPPPWLKTVVEKQGAILLADVPDIRVPLRNAAVVAVPIRVGSGSRLKILEAFALGRPVVSTTIGAEGLELQHETHLLLADTPAEFVEALVRLWDDEMLCAELVRNGRSRVEAQHGWDELFSRLEASWRRATLNRG